jgi:hypothetical protein
LWIKCKKSRRGALYLHCDECEAEWEDPRRAGDAASALMTAEEDFASDYATAPEIDAAGWRPYRLHVA